MKFNKIKIERNVLDINFKFYFFMKELNSSVVHLSSTDIHRFLETYFANQSTDVASFKMILQNMIDRNFKESEKKDALGLLILSITNQQELVSFIFAIKLLQIKPLLLAEAKLIEITELTELKHIDQLSVKYDTISKSRPYYTRVNGALLALLFFDKLEQKDTAFISESTTQYIAALFEEYELLQRYGLAANQMFMLMFSESINQSILSEAGSSYEERIFNVLINIGIPSASIQNVHDAKDKSTEFDFYFELDGKTVGISAKRTLRERYKQFIKTAHMANLDLLIQITLGLDLTEEKAKLIRQHGVILFIADEIYSSRPYLQLIDGVYPCSKLTIDTLKKLF